MISFGTGADVSINLVKILSCEPIGLGSGFLKQCVDGYTIPNYWNNADLSILIG
jgi:hypothetical protein